MTVALGTTLINMGIKNLVKFGGWKRVETARCNGSDIFIGAGVTRFGETKPDIDLCAEVEALLGFVMGYITQLSTIHANGYFYNDYDAPFADNSWVWVGVPEMNGVYLVLSETNTTIAIGHKLKCVDGVFKIAASSDNYQMVAEEPVTAASDTRKYFYARWVKS